MPDMVKAPILLESRGAPEGEFLERARDLVDAVDVLEREISKAHGAAHGVALTSKVDSFRLALVSSGVRSGDAVLLAPNASPEALIALSQIGAQPQWCDVLDDGTLDVTRAAGHLTAATRALVLSHPGGRVGNLAAALAL